MRGWRLPKGQRVEKPFSDVRLTLKQVALSGLGDLQRHALSTALLGYGLTEDPGRAERATAEISEAFAGAPVEFDPTRPRRFAGDRTLPRSRYSSVADNATRSDHGTLLHEMSAYLVGSSYPGLVAFFDNDGANTMEALGILADVPKRNYRALDLAVPSLLVGLRPVQGDPVLRDAYGKGRQYVVQVPYELTTSTISDALDLRRPADRDWLVEQFGTTFEVDDEVFPVLLGRRPPIGFRQLLPSLLDQWLGAGWSTGNMAGFFARQAGAGGLVYPSARSDPWVDVEHGTVAGSGGWCFVSYAGAPDMEISAQVSQASGPWPAVPGYEPQAGSWVREFIPVRNVEIEHRRTKRGRGSFAVRGLGAYNRALYRLSQGGTVLRSIEPKPGRRLRASSRTWRCSAPPRTSRGWPPSCFDRSWATPAPGPCCRMPWPVPDRRRSASRLPRPGSSSTRRPPASEPQGRSPRRLTSPKRRRLDPPPGRSGKINTRAPSTRAFRKWT